MFSSPKNCLRKISGEDQAIFDDLCKRYNHFGGAQEEGSPTISVVTYKAVGTTIGRRTRKKSTS